MTPILMQLICSIALAQDAAPPAAPAATGAKAELAAACAKLADAKSYDFTLKTESTGGGGGFGRGDGTGPGGDGNAPQAPRVTELKGQFESGKPLHLTQGDTDAWVHESKLVTKKGDGAWELIDRESMRNRGGPGGPGGAGSGGAPPQSGGETKTDGEKKPEGAVPGAPRPEGDGRGRGPGGRNSMSLMAVRPPHTLVKDMDAQVADVVAETKDGKTIYKGKLTEKAAAALMSFGRGGRGGRGGPGGDGGEGDGPQRTASGTFEVVVGADGAPESIRLDTHMKVEFMEQAVEMDRKATYVVSQLGKVELTVPPEVLKHFEV